MTYLLTADGRKYLVQRFALAQGKATASLIMTGVCYPDTEKWDGCTLVLGEKRFENVRAIVQSVEVYNPFEEGLAPDTTYTIAMVWSAVTLATPDDTQEADAVRKPPC